MIRVDLDSVLHALDVSEKDLSIEKSLIKFRGLDVYSLGGTSYGLSYNNGSPCILRMNKGTNNVIADSSMFTEDACLFRRFVVAVVNRSKLGEEKNRFTKDNNLNIVMVFLAFRNLKKNAIISSYRFTTPLENENYSRDAKTKGIDYVVVAKKKLGGKEVVFQVTQDGNVRLKSDNSIYASIEDGKSIIDFGREVADIIYNYRYVDNSNVLDIISKVIELHNNDVIRINRKSKFELEVYNAEDLVCKVVHNEYSNSYELQRFSPKGVYSLDLGSLLNDTDIIASEIIRGMTLKDLSGYSKYLVLYILACKFIIGLSTFTVVLSEVSNIKSKWYTSILLDYILDSMYAKVSKFYTTGGTETRINDRSTVMRVATLHNDTNLVEISYIVSANNRHTVQISSNKNTFYSKEGSVFDILDIMFDMDDIVSHIKCDDTDVANSTTQDKEVGVKNMSDSSLTVNEADLFMSLFIDTLNRFSGGTIKETRGTRNISPEGIKTRLDATWLADSDLFYTLFMNGEGDIRIDAVEKDSKRLVNSYSMGVFQDPDVEFFADFCTQFMFSSVKDTQISNKIVYTTYNLISEHISGILGCDKNSVRIDSWTDTEVVYSVSDKAKFRLDLGTHIITYMDNRSVSVSHPLSSDKDEENFIVVIRNRQNELNSMVLPSNVIKNGDETSDIDIIVQHLSSEFDVDTINSVDITTEFLKFSNPRGIKDYSIIHLRQAVKDIRWCIMLYTDEDDRIHILYGTEYGKFADVDVTDLYERSRYCKDTFKEIERFCSDAVKFLFNLGESLNRFSLYFVGKTMCVNKENPDLVMMGSTSIVVDGLLQVDIVNDKLQFSRISDEAILGRCSIDEFAIHKEELKQSMAKHYIPSLVASDKEDNESLVEDEDNIFEGVRIVKLLYNGDVVGFRFKGVNIPGYDVSKETAKKYGVSALKISTAIDLKDHNGLLLSKAEISTGNMIKDISDNHDLVKQLFDYILGVSK